MKYEKTIISRCLITVLILICCVACAKNDAVSDFPDRVILFIGDGMGPDHIRAGRAYAGGPLSFEGFPVHTTLSTFSADNAVTDSAAAATALSTGCKVNNGVIAMRIPGDGGRIPTILERFASAGRWTGLVTTTFVTHATPAAFGAHQPSRLNYDAIGTDYLAARPNIIMGGGANGFEDAKAAIGGYAVIKQKADLDSVHITQTPMIAGLFGTTFMPFEYNGGPRAFGYPNLSDMTAWVVRELDRSPGGFFVMIEGGLIDQAAHRNLTGEMVYEVVEFGNAVRAARQWAEGRDDVLIIVTADHETGGLGVTADNGPGNLPTVAWGSFDHTARRVDLFAWGRGAWRLQSVSDNTGVISAIMP